MLMFNAVVEDFDSTEEADEGTDHEAQKEVSSPRGHGMCQHCVTPGLGYLQPVPTQLLLLQDSGGAPLTMELDSAATVNYVTKEEVLRRGFKMTPNKQVSRLGD